MINITAKQTRQYLKQLHTTAEKHMTKASTDAAATHIGSIASQHGDTGQRHNAIVLATLGRYSRQAPPSPPVPLEQAHLIAAAM